MSDFHNKELNEIVSEFKGNIPFESSVNFPLMPLLFFMLIPSVFVSFFEVENIAPASLIAFIISTISSLYLVSKYMYDKSNEYANDLKKRKAN